MATFRRFFNRQMKHDLPVPALVFSGPVYYASNNTSSTISFASPLTKGYIIVTTFASLSGGNLTVTFDGVSMTDFGAIGSFSGRTPQVFGLAVGSAASGTHTIVISGGFFDIAYCISAYNNINQSVSVGTTTQNEISFGSATNTIAPASVAGDLVIGINFPFGSSVISVGGTQTEVQNFAGTAGDAIEVSYAPGLAGTTSISVTHNTTSQTDMYYGFALKQ